MNYVRCASFAADGSYIALIVGDGEVDHLVLWDPEADQRLGPFGLERFEQLELEREGGFIGVCCSTDGRYIMAAEGIGVVHLWTMEHNRIVQSRSFVLDEDVEVWAAGLSSNSEYVFISFEGYLEVWHLSDWTEVRDFEIDYFPYSQAVFSPDNQSIIMGSQYSGLERREIATGKIIQKSNICCYEPVERIVFINGADMCYVWDSENIYVWDLGTNRAHTISDIDLLNRPVTCGDVSFNNELLVSIFGKDVICWDLSAKKVLQQYVGHEEQVVQVNFSPDAKHVLTVSWDGTARLWDTYSGKELKRFVP